MLSPASFLEREGARITYLPVDSAGLVDPDDLRRALSRDTVLVSIMHANNETGTIQPVEACARIARVGARVVLLDDERLLPGDSAEFQLVLDRPVAAAVPDPFVLRDVSGKRTLGGGHFLDLRPPSRRPRTRERALQRAAFAMADPVAAFEALLSTPPFAWDLTAFARDRALSKGMIEQP